MTRVLITGAGGFIAGHLARSLQARGVEVVGVSRQPQEMDGFSHVFACRLGESLAPAVHSGRYDAVVHTALATGADAHEINVRGTDRWLQEAAAAGIGTQVFLSSLSAAADADSDYGRSKFEIEGAVLDAGGVVFRLGVVVGNGGMCGRLVETARRFPVVPLLDNGSQYVYVLGIDFLCGVLGDCVVGLDPELRGQAWNLQQPEPYTLRQVVEAINRHFAYRRLLLPVPLAPVLAALRLAERMPFLRIPISAANVQGLRRQARRRIPSDFPRFGYPVQSLPDLLASANW